jgi:hypothetical protein
MRVRCVKILDIRGAEAADSWAIHVGDECDVLEISATPRHEVLFRIESRPSLGHKTPILLDSRMFETVDGRIPRNWAVRVGGDGYVCIGPAPWLVDGFWERYFDREADAEAIFDSEKARIVEEPRLSDRG